MTDKVSCYETGFPDVLRPPAKMLSGSQTSFFYAYFIHYSTVNKGPYDFPTMEFLLLNHFKLDWEVANNLSVKLWLPHKERAIAWFEEGDIITLDEEQVLLMKLFNTSLFGLVLGKGPIISKCFDVVENQVKGYHVMPIKDGSDLRCKQTLVQMIDWIAARNLVNYKLTIRSCTPPLPVQNQEETGHSDYTCLMEKESFKLRSGLYRHEDLLDAFVTYGPWSLPCFIVGISKELSGSSMVEENDCLTYADYWMKKHKVKIIHVSQPLLVGYTLSRAGNFLQQPSGGQDGWCRAKAKRVSLPPEVCILHSGLQGCLWRGGFRLPSILCALENSLRAAQIRDHIGAPLSAFKVEESLTSGAYNVDVSYERLEFLGDSFLTFVAGATLFLNDSALNADSLAASVHDLVENKRLFQYAKACNLASYVLNEPFQVKGWIPPGPIPEERELQLGLFRKQRISQRTLADVVEALVGAYVLHGSNSSPFKAMSWLKIPLKYPGSSAEMLLGDIKKSMRREGISLTTFAISFVESKISYRFKDSSFLLPIVNGDIDSNADFLRLVYLGDTILSYFVARHLVMVHPSFDVGDLNLMKQSIINKENLACVSVKSELYHILQDIFPTVKERISLYVALVEKERVAGRVVPAYGLPGVCAPKVLGDAISALAAAMFLDSKLDGNAVWKVFRPLLEPLPKPGCIPLHPINELISVCRRRGFSLDLKCMLVSGIFQAHVFVNEVMLGKTEHEEKHIARKFAAVKALQQLLLPANNADEAEHCSSL